MHPTVQHPRRPWCSGPVPVSLSLSHGSLVYSTLSAIFVALCAESLWISTSIKPVSSTPTHTLTHSHAQSSIAESEHCSCSTTSISALFGFSFALFRSLLACAIPVCLGRRINKFICAATCCCNENKNINSLYTYLYFVFSNTKLACQWFCNLRTSSSRARIGIPNKFVCWALRTCL